MANVLLVSVNDITALGIRLLCSCLKKEGHKVSVLFFKRPGFPYSNYKASLLQEARKVEDYDWVGIDQNGKPYRYSRGPEPTPTEYGLLLSFMRSLDPDIVGFSVTTPLVRRAGEVSRFIKSNFHIPIVWGGPGATMDPEGCLDYCDFACVGEGEKVIHAIAEAIDNQGAIEGINNLCYRDDNRLIRNPQFPLIDDLNELPFQDVGPEGKYLIEDDSLVENFGEISYSKRYHMMGSRGCMNNCSFCAEDYYRKLYPKRQFLRRRSPSSVIRELMEAKRIADFEVVQFEDEIFPRDYEWLKEFASLYKTQIGLPFTCYIYPFRDLENHLPLLKEAGLADTSLSLQSGSERINKEIFHRPFSKDLYLQAARLLDSMAIKFYVDIITYNPFETEDDLKATADILLQIPKPIALFINKLYILKNTTMADLMADKNCRREKNSVPERLFDYYVRLFWFAITEDRKIIDFCQKVRIFRVFPGFLRSNWFLARLRQFVRLIPPSLLT